MLSFDQKSLFEKVIHRLRTQGPSETLLLMARRSIGLVRSYREDLRRGVSTSRVSNDKELGISFRAKIGSLCGVTCYGFGPFVAKGVTGIVCQIKCVEHGESGADFFPNRQTSLA